MKVSFCTSCMGRAHHLKETLPKNIADNAGFPDLEFVIVDYNSKDGLEDWARVALKDHIASGRVVYLAERSAAWFEKCHAKNIAHCAASGDVLVNIDADNFTGDGYAAFVADFFSRDPASVLTSKWGQLDIVGKVGMLAASFHKIRGYDELLKGYGTEDVDLARRGKAAGLAHIRVDWAGQAAIPHGHDVRSANLEGGESHHDSHKRNVRTIGRRKPGQVINPHGYGRAAVFRNFSDKPENVGVGGIA